MQAPWLYLMTSPIVLLICMLLPVLNCLLLQIHCHHHLRHAITLNVQTNPRQRVSERVRVPFFPSPPHRLQKQLYYQLCIN